LPAKEDCVARSLVKGESRDEDNLTDAQLKGNDEEPFDDEEINAETHKENRESSEDGEETGNTSDEHANRRESQDRCNTPPAKCRSRETLNRTLPLVRLMYVLVR
jgi:hypothetical protein